ncbi:Gfo/Idh/MocA family oxidoreductase [Cohnella pontilimi]|uniref:Gfo/Idh/MocA family oxidoreductase n=1 Tax=Cohnella pontilimi TaxID=2564100 RepID=A0A4V6WEH2_9BACL|nr:Gfo/Idh/MocA family oxidoreductase [Cohnella pontilimi]TJY42259.1 Gfo/Idh/MocA family oxidoreductase [Cohnella pontilimi]
MSKLRIGMIGTGGISHWHGRQLLELPEVEIVALADTNPQSRKQFIEKFGLVQVNEYDDYGALLEQDKPDAVVICSPHTLHYEQATKAMESGCHVLIEKPMACSSDEAKRMIEVSRRTGKLLQVSYQRHFQPDFLYIKEAIASGVIGKLTSITASLYQEWAQLTTGTWRQDPSLSGGGMLMDSGSHIVDVLLWTTGLTPAEVSTQLHKQGTPVEINSFTSIRFTDGTTAGLNIVGHAPCWHETYVFCGETGGIFYDNGKISIRRMQQEPEYPEIPEQTTNQDKSFIDAIMGRHEVLVPGEFALRVVELTEMIYQAWGYEPRKG